jgi:chlorobactene glucosyltransferase
MEILVLDEGSDDQTAQVVAQLAQEYRNIHWVPIQRDQEEGSNTWSGKNYAQHLGALRARGDWYLFLDPNVVIQPFCISRCLAYSLENKIDFFSLMPGNELRSFWERLILPIVFGWFGTRFSVSKVNDPSSTQALAVSQFMLIRKEAYQASGGFQNVKGEILEDSALAREIKSLGLKYRLVGGKHLMTSRTYGGLKEIWQRCERVFVGEVGSSPLHIFWTFLVIGLTGIAPFASVLYFAYLGLDTINPIILMVCTFQCVMVLSARVVLDWVLGIGLLYAFLHPIGAIFSLAILTTSLYHLTFGSLEHVKGRVSSEL